MKFIKACLLTAISVIPVLSPAQTVVSTVNNIKYSLIASGAKPQILQCDATCSAGGKYTEGKSTDIIKIDDNSVIAPVQLDAKHYGVIRFNKDMTAQWTTNIDGYPLAIGVFHDNILVITTDNIHTYTGEDNSFTGYIIDPKTSQVILKKQIYSGGEEFYQQPEFLFAPDGSTFKLAVRTSTLTKKLHMSLAFNANKGAEAYYDTSDFEILGFDANLDVQSTVKPVLEPGYFIGAAINKAGDVFLMTNYEQDIMKIARYESGKTKPAKVLQLPISMGDDVFANLTDNYFFPSKDDPMVVFTAMTYQNQGKDRELAVAKYNFRDGTVGRDIEVMDKDYLKQLKKSYVPFDKKYDDVDLGPTSGMEIKNVMEYKGKLIVALSSYQVRNNTYTNGSSSYTNSSIKAFDILVNLYDEKTNLQFQQIIPRTYTSLGAVWLGVGMHCKNDMLYLIANNDKGIFGFKSLFGQIDLKTGAIANIAGISKEGIKNGYSADPYSSLWFDNQLILSYMEMKGIFSYSEDAHMQLISY
jgi:hypothetical protein